MPKYVRKPKRPPKKNRTTIEVENNGERALYILINPETKQLTRYRGWRNYDVALSQIKGASVVSNMSWLRGHFGLDKKRKRKGVAA